MRNRIFKVITGLFIVVVVVLTTYFVKFLPVSYPDSLQLYFWITLGIGIVIQYHITFRFEDHVNWVISRRRDCDLPREHWRLMVWFFNFPLGMGILSLSGFISIGTGESAWVILFCIIEVLLFRISYTNISNV